MRRYIKSDYVYYAFEVLNIIYPEEYAFEEFQKKGEILLKTLSISTVC
jgi:hypothetical protein